MSHDPRDVPVACASAVFARPHTSTANQGDSDRCHDRAGEGESDVLPEAGESEPGDAGGVREGGSAYQMETR